MLRLVYVLGFGVQGLGIGVWGIGVRGLGVRADAAAPALQTAENPHGGSNAKTQKWGFELHILDDMRSVRTCARVLHVHRVSGALISHII